MNLPVDFEQKVKLPPQVNGRSYPYQISAKDLMQDFRYAALQVDGSEVGGLQLVETIEGDGTRTVKLDGEIVAAFRHPFKVKYDGFSQYYCEGYVGDILLAGSITSEGDEYLYVKIERNTASRVIINATFEQGYPIPTSTEEFQYIAIAFLDGEDTLQARFEDIRLTEFLISDAGELKLVSVFDTTNTYALP